MSNVTISTGKTVSFSAESTVCVPGPVGEDAPATAINCVHAVMQEFDEVKDQLALDPGEYTVKLLVVITSNDD
jgi:hypothetical protein